MPHPSPHLGCNGGTKTLGSRHVPAGGLSPPNLVRCFLVVAGMSRRCQQTRLSLSLYARGSRWRYLVVTARRRHVTEVILAGDWLPLLPSGRALVRQPRPIRGSAAQQDDFRKREFGFHPPWRLDRTLRSGGREQSSCGHTRPIASLPISRCRDRNSGAGISENDRNTHRSYSLSAEAVGVMHWRGGRKRASADATGSRCA